MSRGFSVPDQTQVGTPQPPVFVSATFDNSGRLTMYFDQDLTPEPNLEASHQFILQYDWTTAVLSRANIPEDIPGAGYAQAQVAPAGFPRAVVAVFPNALDDAEPVPQPIPWDECSNFLVNYNPAAPAPPEHPAADITNVFGQPLADFTSDAITYRPSEE